MFSNSSVSVTRRDLLELFDSIQDFIVPGHNDEVKESFEGFWDIHAKKQEGDELKKMQAKEAREKKKAHDVFDRLRKSLGPAIEPQILSIEALEALSNSIDLRNHDAVELHKQLAEQDKLFRKRTGITAYYLGRIYHRHCIHYQRTLTALADEFKASYYEVQSRLQIYNLLTELPRLRYCAVPATFLHENATIILSERWRERDSADWLDPNPPLFEQDDDTDAAADNVVEAAKLQALLNQYQPVQLDLSQHPAGPDHPAAVTVNLMDEDNPTDLPPPANADGFANPLQHG